VSHAVLTRLDAWTTIRSLLLDDLEAVLASAGWALRLGGRLVLLMLSSAMGLVRRNVEGESIGATEASATP